MAVAMRALDAKVETVKSDGSARSIPIAEFHTSAWRYAAYRDVAGARRVDHRRRPCPKPVGGTHVYRKVRDRASYAFALVSVGAIIQPTGLVA